MYAFHKCLGPVNTVIYLFRKLFSFASPPMYLMDISQCISRKRSILNIYIYIYIYIKREDIRQKGRETILEIKFWSFPPPLMIYICVCVCVCVITLVSYRVTSLL